MPIDAGDPLRDAPSLAAAIDAALDGLPDVDRDGPLTSTDVHWLGLGIRLGLERLVMSRLTGHLTRDQIKELEAHVEQEERARGNNEPLSIRLATEYHILLAKMTGSSVLARYVSEFSSRCGLILSLYSRPHSSECAVNEHHAVIAALVAGDVGRACAVMEEHLEGVASRALIVSRPPRNRDLRDVLASYADEERRSVAKSAFKRIRN